MATTANTANGADVAKGSVAFPTTAGAGLTLADELGDDQDIPGADQLDVLGYELISTTGGFYIDREWLLETMEAVGLPLWMAPSETAPHLAFTRALDELVEPPHDETEYSGNIVVRFRFEKDGNSRYSGTLLAIVHRSSEHVDEEGGHNETFELGAIRYDNEAQRPVFSGKLPDPSEVSDRKAGSITTLQNRWDWYQTRMRHLFVRHMNGHVSDNIGTMLADYFLGRWTDSTMLRPAVYFVPANHVIKGSMSPTGDEMTMREVIGWDKGPSDRQGFAGLYAELDDYKRGQYDGTTVGDGRELDAPDQTGPRTEPTEIIKVPIYDNADQKEMIERRVQSELKEAVREAYKTILKQAEDEAPEKIAKGLSERMEGLTGKQGTYKELIKMELTVEDIMGDVLGEMSDDVDAGAVKDVLEEMDEVGTVD